MNERYSFLSKVKSATVRLTLSAAAVALLSGWAGLDVKPLQKSRSDLVPGQSGTYAQLSDDERKELVWMAKAAMAAYADGAKPLGYRSFTRGEWNACSENCSELTYCEDGSFTVGSGLRGRLMVHMVNEGRVVLALCGVDDCNLDGGLAAALDSKDLAACMQHYTGRCTPDQYRQALNLMNGILRSRPRSNLWIV